MQHRLGSAILQPPCDLPGLLKTSDLVSLFQAHSSFTDIFKDLLGQSGSLSGFMIQSWLEESSCVWLVDGELSDCKGNATNPRRDR